MLNIYEKILDIVIEIVQFEINTGGLLSHETDCEN